MLRAPEGRFRVPRGLLVVTAALAQSCGSDSQPSGAAERVFSTRGVIDMAATPDHVYWLASDSVASPPVSEIYQVTEDGPQRVIGSLSLAQAFAVDAHAVYWSSLDEDKLYRAPNDGSGPPAELAAIGGAAVSTAVDSSFVYWSNFRADATEHGTIRRVASSGGAVETIASGLESPSQLRLDASSIYWMTIWGHAVVRMPLGGGAPQQLMALGSCGPWGMTIDDTYVYAICTGFDGERPASTIVRALKSGGETHTFVSSDSYPNAIDTDGSAVYWTEYDLFDGGRGRVMQASGDGDVQVLVSTTGTPIPDSVLVSSGYVYWTMYDADCADPPCSEVWRMAR